MAKIKAKYGYCGMTADFLHVGHINFLNKCKKHCKHLVVGVMTDKCIEKYKGHKPIMTTAQRKRILRSLKQIDCVTEQRCFNFPIYFINNKNFIVFDSDEHNREGADIIIPYTKGISSSIKRAGL